mgnify:CR=1 FL=1
MPMLKFETYFISNQPSKYVKLKVNHSYYVPISSSIEFGPLRSTRVRMDPSIIPNSVRVIVTSGQSICVGSFSTCFKPFSVVFSFTNLGASDIDIVVTPNSKNQS